MFRNNLIKYWDFYHGVNAWIANSLYQFIITNWVTSTTFLHVKHLEVPLINANPFIDIKDFVKMSDFMGKHGDITT